METWLLTLLQQHAPHAHWLIFLGLLLAGCNIPISIDVLVILAAVLAAHFVPEHFWILYITLFVGCTCSAWIAYGLGRGLGSKLATYRAFHFLFSEKKIHSIKKFYAKYGALAFLLGRFIPFGARNCLFMTSGLSKMPFLRFLLLDLLACSLWVSVTYLSFFYLGKNFDTLVHQVKKINLGIFLIFILAVIVLVCYKLVKNPLKSKEKNIT